MKTPILKDIEVTNFRSIRGRIHAPLDAKVVLIHGENGAGKTSLLSAVELALTGGVQSLHSADPAYTKQLLHHSSEEGKVLLNTLGLEGPSVFETLLDTSGATAKATLEKRLASFFEERAYLPQSLLGQLLQIYQDSDSGANSPLAKFVGKLLGLDRLDALETGIKPLVDIRNVRKIADGWEDAEGEKKRLNLILDALRNERADVIKTLSVALNALKTIGKQIAPELIIEEEGLGAINEVLGDDTDAIASEELLSRVRELVSIRKEISQAQDSAGEPSAMPDADAAAVAYRRWETGDGVRVKALRTRIEQLLPDSALPSDYDQFVERALVQLRAADNELNDRTVLARADDARRVSAISERDAALVQRHAIDTEVSSISGDAGAIASVLAELTSFIDSDTCPACDRDFSEQNSGTLSDHVHTKVKLLSGTAERLLSLSRTRSEVQVKIEQLEREIEVLSSRNVEANVLAEIDRQSAGFSRAIAELEQLENAFRVGGRLRMQEVSARRALMSAQSRTTALLSARETLNAFTSTTRAARLEEGESFEAAVERIQSYLDAEITRLSARVRMRREGLEHVVAIQSAKEKLAEIDDRIAEETVAWERVNNALTEAQRLRDDGIAIRNAVDRVRSSIIRREFNDRLNLLWGDLFVRLAPTEPFVPAFRIPTSGTQRLQPKLTTDHRLGGSAGGTPGAMLSAGNLNTAALTLFVALHLAVPEELPWLILDDPVQSMDDVHIAHFAALLRTLSKEHGRQILIAVHDRQLFEYLRLELSPAFADDSLLTLELSRSRRRDTLCRHERFSFQEEIAFSPAA